MEFSTTVGLAMVAASLLLFAVLVPRRGRISPILRSDGVETALAMLFLLGLSVGGAFALMGFPVGIITSVAR